MADAIISAVLGELASLTAQKIQEDVMLVTGVPKEVEKLTNYLRAIRVWLVDADQHIQVKEQSFRDPDYDQLKDVAYNMEDVLDEWNTARLKKQIEGVDDDNFVVALMKKVCSSLFASTSLCSVLEVCFRHDIAVEIKDLNEKLAEIDNMKNMRSSLQKENKSVEKPDRGLTISIVDESNIFGRENDEVDLINMLCKSGESSAQQENLHIISIIGIGGLGKTTLAQLAYNNEEVKKNFGENRKWVCVSNKFDKLRVAKTIIGDSTSTSTDDLEHLMQSVRQSITGKKILLILDDVWEEADTEWKPFYTCLKKDCLPGSKILITTREEETALLMGSTKIKTILPLDNEKCWLLLSRLAFFNRSPDECQNLEQIGRQIADKCEGLPLAANIMGKLLSSKRFKIDWERILVSQLWKLGKIRKELLPELLLSYNDFPDATIRQCFLYCAVFPKDYDIRKDELIRLWMAQGYLSADQDEDIESTGEKYFDFLAQRSFFQEFERDEEGIIQYCKMHDIVHDFAQFLCKNEFFSCEVSSNGELVPKPNGGNIRHLMLRFGHEEASFDPVSIFEVKKLRSLLIEDGFLDSAMIRRLYCELSCLRTFNIANSGDIVLEEIAGEIGKMIHLRYLNLSNQNMEVLPDTLCELYNLQILDVSYCFRLKELPRGIGKLINLRELLNRETDSLCWMPAEIARLTSLRILTKLVVGGGSQGCSLETLKNLNFLRKCGIHELGNMSLDDLVDQVKRSELEKKKNLWYLDLRFDSYWDETEEGRNKKDEEVLGALQPPPNLKELYISDYRGNSFHSWKWVVSLTKLRSLSLYHCRNCEHLPALGKLESLEQVVIVGLDRVRRVDNEFMGIESDVDTSSSSSSSVNNIVFPKLKSLVFDGMNEWEEWDSEITRYGGEIMPRLSELKIRYCPKLKALPDYILENTTLQILPVGLREELAQDISNF